ncbi:hypothetical protein S40288_04116 [Stachybotrys chartarum IBT 40288]|nr:hypothetical protein S40288_04116 [Stachybotrys chartarum IBT 40288]
MHVPSKTHPSGLHAAAIPSPRLPITRLPSVLPEAETSPTAGTPSPPSPDPDHSASPNHPKRDPEALFDNLHLQRTATARQPHYFLPLWRKWIVVLVLSLTVLCMPFATTSLFPLTPEISTTLHTSEGFVIAINAVTVAVMGFSNFFWSPVGRLIGRKQAWLVGCAVYILSTAGAALAQYAPPAARVPIFVVMRIVLGLWGTMFAAMGQTYIAEMFQPTERGTATGFFLLGSTFGPAFGPLVSGIMVSFVHWTSVLWLQAAMMSVAFMLSVLYLPFVGSNFANEPNEKSSPSHTASRILTVFNPSHVIKILQHPNVLLADFACGFVSWNQYTLLAAPRHLLNPRFNLTTPLVSGLFYIAPGIGFILGAVVGGKLSDMTVIKYIKIRGGVRLPQDRLNSGLSSFFFLAPVSSLIYGWGLQYEVGGLALPIVTAFFSAVGINMAFASLNTYCAEVLPKQRTEVVASKYVIQYSMSSIGCGVIISMIDAIGVGPAQTLGSLLVVLAGFFIWIIAKHGLRIQRWHEKKNPQSTGSS